MPAAPSRGLKRQREERGSAGASQKRAKVSKKGGTKGGVKASKKAGTWYSQRLSHWNDTEPTTLSMVGEKISGADVAFSLKFVDSLKKSRVGKKCAFRAALDVGAGIGRISRKVLVRKVKERVDLVEHAPKLLQKARAMLKGKRQASSFFCSGLQDFVPAKGRYDLIWCQWVFQYLTDADMIRFLRRASAGLGENGLMVVKENVSFSAADSARKGAFSYLNVDPDGDKYHLRNPKRHEDIFSKAGLRVVVKRLQKFSNWEGTMGMYALAPANL
jgi:protein N-terminal methyltransferase